MNLPFNLCEILDIVGNTQKVERFLPEKLLILYYQQRAPFLS